MDDIRRGYDGLRRHGVQIVNDEATAVDAARKVIRLQHGGDLSYDRLIVSPRCGFPVRRSRGLRGSDELRARSPRLDKAGRRP